MLAAPALMVHGGGSCCLLERLGGHQGLADDPLLSSATLACFSEEAGPAGPSVELWPHHGAAPACSHGALVALGHQTRCPCQPDDAQPDRPVRLASVALVIDPLDRVLLTRRPRSMRSFPGCWVAPGGSVDAADGSMALAAARELREETGLVATEVPPTPLCLWESCYPTTQEEWAARREAGARVGHHLVAPRRRSTAASTTSITALRLCLPSTGSTIAAQRPRRWQ